jgi:hypothetical protein
MVLVNYYNRYIMTKGNKYNYRYKFFRTLIKIPPCSKALSAEHRPKFCSPSPAMVTSP